MGRVLAASLLIVFLAVGAVSAFQAVTTNLVAHWDFQTITTVTPRTTVSQPGPGFTGTLVQGTAGLTPVAGLFGQSLQFDGTDDRITIPNNAALNVGTGSFTVAAWVKPANTSNGRLINKWDGPAQQGWIMDINAGVGGAAAPGNLRFRMDSSTTSNAAADNLDYTTPASLGTGAWKHVAASADRAAGQLRLYVNGTQVGTTQTIPATIATLSNTFELGMGTIPSSLGVYLNADLDEVRLYTAALTPPQILTLVQPLPPTGLGAVVNGNQVDLSWTGSTGSVNYNLYRSTTSGSGYVPIASALPGTTYTDTPPTYGTYFYGVRGYNVVEGNNSNEATAVVVPPPPRFNDHEEGLFDDQCNCATTSSPGLGGILALLGLALLLRRQKQTV